MIELNDAQCREVSGGNVWVAVALGIAIYDAATDFVDGLMAGAMSQAPK